MNLELPAEIINHAIEELNKTVEVQLKHYLRLSSQRDVYTVPQAAFRLNISRNEFENLFVSIGKIKLLIRNGKKFVAANEIEQYIKQEARYYPKEFINKRKFI